MVMKMCDVTNVQAVMSTHNEFADLVSMLGGIAVGVQGAQKWGEGTFLGAAVLMIGVSDVFPKPHLLLPTSQEFSDQDVIGQHFLRLLFDGMMSDLQVLVIWKFPVVERHLI